MKLIVCQDFLGLDYKCAVELNLDCKCAVELNLDCKCAVYIVNQKCAVELIL